HIRNSRQRGGLVAKNGNAESTAAILQCNGRQTGHSLYAAVFPLSGSCTSEGAAFKMDRMGCFKRIRKYAGGTMALWNYEGTISAAACSHAPGSVPALEHDAGWARLGDAGSGFSE